MTRIVGIRDGHRVTTTVPGSAGSLSINQQHHPDCPCRTVSARTSRRRKSTTRREARGALQQPFPEECSC